MTRVTFLGTAAALPTGDRGNTMLAVTGPSGEPGLLIDCGDGVYRALVRAELGPDAIGDLFITHAHIDHLGGLPSLLESFRLSGRKRPLRIYAIPEALDIARKLLDVFAFELTLDSWPYAVSLTAVDEDSALSFLGVKARIYRMTHSIPSAGLRLDLPTGALAYTCDTQPNPNILPLGQNARLLIAECTMLQQNVSMARLSKHMTALECGQQADACAAESLALVHLGVAGGWSVAQAAAEAAQAFSGPIITPLDGDTIEL